MKSMSRKCLVCNYTHLKLVTNLHLRGLSGEPSERVTTNAKFDKAKSDRRIQFRKKKKKRIISPLSVLREEQD